MSETRPAPSSDDLALAVDAFLTRVEQTLEARVDAQLQDRLDSGHLDSTNHGRSYTMRIASSLAISIPLVAVAAALGHQAGGVGVVASVLAVLSTVFGLNVYYTEAEIRLEQSRRKRQP
jgi:hypothetical protein